MQPPWELFFFHEILIVQNHHFFRQTILGEGVAKGKKLEILKRFEKR